MKNKKSKKNVKISKKSLEVLAGYRDSFKLGGQQRLLLSNRGDFKTELKEIHNILGGTFFRIKFLPRAKLENETSNNPLLKFNYPEDKKLLKLLGYKTLGFKKDIPSKIRRKKYVFDAHYLIWREFCDKWQIRYSWDGKRKTLKNYDIYSVRIGTIQRHTVGRKRIIIEIDNKAKIEEVIDKWKIVKKLQNEELGGKEEEKANFYRDLCWYRLSKEGDLSASQIAEIWNKNYPDDIDLLVIRRVRKSLKSHIENRLAGKNMYDNQLLEYIKNGEWSDVIIDCDDDDDENGGKYGKYFNDERDYYVTGRQKGKEIRKEIKLTQTTPLFIDVVTKAINRMKEQLSKRPLMPPEQKPLTITYHD